MNLFSSLWWEHRHKLGGQLEGVFCNNIQPEADNIYLNDRLVM